jgi:hypothetical protein
MSVVQSSTRDDQTLSSIFSGHDTDSIHNGTYRKQEWDCLNPGNGALVHIWTQIPFLVPSDRLLFNFIFRVLLCDQYVRRKRLFIFKTYHVANFVSSSIEKLIAFAAEKKILQTSGCFRNERWHCYDAHSDL